MVEFHLGIDDTDNPEGGCTTYTISRIIDLLFEKDHSFKLLDFPKLIRLNPNVPYKTRGNGAVAIFASSTMSLNQINEIVKEIVVTDTAQWAQEGFTEPSYILIENKNLKDNKEIYWKALQEMLNADEIQPLLANGIIWSRGSNRSLIGSFSAIQADIQADFTFELIAYRKPENLGKERIFDVEKLKGLMRKYHETTFSNYDFIENRELIAPSGPDPVFCGIRGEDPEILKEIFNKITFAEPLEGFTIFKTNQGTGHHLIKPFHSFSPNEVHTGMYRLISEPEIIMGGHVKLRARDSYSTRVIDLMAFEPTKTISKVAQKLRAGDLIFIAGAVKEKGKNLSISIEELRILEVAIQQRVLPPVCPNCNKRMTSAGKFKGYKCKRCNKKKLRGDQIRFHRPKPIENVKILSVPSAQRHLTKPYERYGRKPSNSFSMSRSLIREKLLK